MKNLANAQRLFGKRINSTALMMFFCFSFMSCTDSSDSKTIKNADESVTRLSTAKLNPGNTWEPDNYSTKDYPPAPPIIPAPQYACTPEVLVTGCVENAIVELVVNGDSANTYTATADSRGRATLTVPPLQIHDTLVATQSINGVTSDASTTRIVEALRYDELPTPNINNPVWECGRLVGAEGIIPGMFLSLEKNGAYETEDWSTDKWGNGFWPIKTPTSLGPVNAAMTVQQIYCPKDANSSVSSLKSAPALIQQSPNPLPDFTTVKALEGTEKILVDGTFFGSRNEFYRDSSNLGYIYAKWRRFNAIVHETIDPTLYSYSATHELCPGSAPKPKQADIISSNDVAKMLSDITIREPICPGTTAIQIESELSGDIALSYNGSPVESATIGVGVSTIGVPQGLLQNGGVLEVVQIAQGTASTGNIEGTPATATVGASFGLKAFGAESYTNQNTNQSVEGFVRNGEQRSRGPRFELSCCASCQCNDCELTNEDQCLVDGEPQTATLEIDDGSNIYTITLYEDFPGHYVGRWDWFVENANAPVWPPAAGEPKASVIDSPCGQQADVPIRILVGEPDLQDNTTPEYVKLTVTGADGEHESVDDTSGNKTLDVLPVEEGEIEVRMKDPEGAKELSYDSNSNDISPPTSKSSDPNIVPIPTKLSFDTTFDDLQPYESFEISATGANFSQSSNFKTVTDSLTVKGDHPEPVLDDATPTSAYSDQTLTLTGDYLAYDTLETRVRFDGPNGIVESTNFTPSIDTLSDIELPSSLDNYFGEIEIWVVTRYNGQSGVIEKESNHLTITLLNRNSSFQTKDGDDFNSTLALPPSGCSSNTAPGGITNVTIGSSSSSDAMVTIESNGRSVDKTVNFNTASVGSGSTLGGVVLFDNSCRIVAVMSKSDQGPPPEFTLILLYFPKDSSQAVMEHKIYNIGFHYQDDVGYHYAPNAFNILANGGDGSIIAVGNPVSNINYNKLKVFGHIHDMLKPDNTNGHQSSGNPISFNTNYSYNMEIDGRDATLKIGPENNINIELVNWILDD